MEDTGYLSKVSKQPSHFREQLDLLNTDGLKEMACFLIGQFAKERAEQSLEDLVLYVQIISLLKSLDNEGLQRVSQYADDISDRFPNCF